MRRYELRFAILKIFNFLLMNAEDRSKRSILRVKCLVFLCKKVVSLFNLAFQAAYFSQDIIFFSAFFFQLSLSLLKLSSEQLNLRIFLVHKLSIMKSNSFILSHQFFTFTLNFLLSFGIFDSTWLHVPTFKHITSCFLLFSCFFSESFDLLGVNFPLCKQLIV